ncbi:MAG: hypothetical protein LBS88_03830 [Tannerellaceae bacterium]|jgi:hypothetical protein|nr:hypothetical protein [Tannerellaceae bacterium]
MENFGKSSFNEAKEIEEVLKRIQRGREEEEKDWPEFELINREELSTDSETESLTRSAYNSSIPIGRYLWLGKPNKIDHYYGTEDGTVNEPVPSI